MTRPEEDEAWRSIVENYGERARLDDLPTEPEARAPAIEPESPGPESPAPESPAPEAFDASQFPSFDNAWLPPEPEDAGYEVADRFVPPDPPVPIPAPPRLLAWLGVFGAPTLLLICVVLSITLPSPVSFGLVAWFVGGFAYLFWQMPKGPQDPWDNGARV